MLAEPFDAFVHTNARMFTHCTIDFERFEALSMCSINAPSDRKPGVHDILSIYHASFLGCGPCLRSSILLPSGGSLGAWPRVYKAMQLLELFCGDIRIFTLLSRLDSGNPSNNMADQVSMFPPGKIKVAAKFADGRYLIACSTEAGPYAYLGYPEAMQALKVHAYKVFENGKTFDITISTGNLHFDSKSKVLVFEWEQDGEIVWAEKLKHIKIGEKVRSHL